MSDQIELVGSHYVAANAATDLRDDLGHLLGVGVQLARPGPTPVGAEQQLQRNTRQADSALRTLQAAGYARENVGWIAPKVPAFLTRVRLVFQAHQRSDLASAQSLERANEQSFADVSRDFQQLIDEERQGAERAQLVVKTAIVALAVALAGGVFMGAWLLGRSRRRAADRQFRLLFEEHPLPMWIYDRKSGAFLVVNRAAVSTYGFEADEFLHMTIRDIRPVDDVPALEATMARQDPALRHQGQWRHLTKDGRQLTVEITSHLIDYDGRRATLVTAQDVTEQVEAQAQLEVRATQDELTGLANRRLLNDRISQSLARARRSGIAPVLIYIDVDSFKILNDSKGHGAGDEVLRQIARRLERAIRAEDTAARVGGDEYVVLLQGPLTSDEIRAASMRVGWALEAPYTIDGEEFFLTSSLGIAVAHHDDDADTVLHRADAAMYAAKEQGAGRSAFADEDDDSAGTTASLRLGTDLRSALAQSQFVLYYQPIVELASGTIVGAEALIRWNHPDRGLLGPGDFIPYAESSGLIVPIGEWVLRDATTTASRWSTLTSSPLFVSVNLSAAQLTSRNLAFVVARSLSHSSLHAESLHLEVTETLLIRNIGESQRVLESLRKLGPHIAADDFGTGYSSLSHVQRLPINTVKIDKAFVDHIDSGDTDGAITDSIIRLGDALNLTVIAEGVERDSQRLALLARGCQYAQGYLFAKPMPAGDFEALIHNDARLPTGSALEPWDALQRLETSMTEGALR